MLKKLLLIGCVLILLASCNKVGEVVSSSTSISKDKEIAAQMLYRGLMYGKLEQIKPYVSDDLFEHIASNPNHLQYLRSAIPKKEVLSREIYLSKKSLKILPFIGATHEVIFHYKYPERIVVYTVYYESKTSKIDDFQIQNSPLITVN